MDDEDSGVPPPEQGQRFRFRVVSPDGRELVSDIAEVLFPARPQVAPGAGAQVGASVVRAAASGPTPGLTTPAFPHTIPTPPVPNAKLQGALDAAIAAGPGARSRTPITIVSLEDDGTRPMANFNGTDLHFSASLLKVAAMYSAFQLRETLRAIAVELGANTSRATLLKEAAAHLDPLIMDKVATIPALKGVKRIHALPQYKRMFEVTASSSGDGFSVDFSKAFVGGKGHLERMIAVSDNNSAAECIHGSGYGFLNGLLQSAGFFDSSTNNGIWLAGDFVGAYPTFRIKSVNDGLVKQATTTLQMASLFTLLHDRLLVPAASTEMLDLLAAAVAVPEVFIERASDLDFTVTRNKLGVAALKPENGGNEVCSEASMLTHDSTGREFVVVWQNFIPGRDGFDPIGHVIRDTIRGFIAP